MTPLKVNSFGTDKVRVPLVISEYRNINRSYLAPFPSYRGVLVK